MGPDQAHPPGEQSEMGGVSQAIVEVNAGLEKLQEMFSQSGALTPEDMQAFASIVDGYQAFVEKNLSSPPGQNAAQPNMDPATSSPEAGGRGSARPMMA